MCFSSARDMANPGAFWITILPDSVKVIDLSADFRLNDGSHNFVYGLPELNREAIRHARRIANPGCFATGIELALLPLAGAGLLSDDIHVQAITGSTGAGQLPSETTHFSWREGNLSAYKIFSHQHQEEILQSIRQLQPAFDWEFNFIPVRGTIPGDLCDGVHPLRRFRRRCPRTLYQLVPRPPLFSGHLGKPIPQTGHKYQQSTDLH